MLDANTSTESTETQDSSQYIWVDHFAFYDFFLDLPDAVDISPSMLPPVARGLCWFGKPELLPDLRLRTH